MTMLDSWYSYQVTLSRPTKTAFDDGRLSLVAKERADELVALRFSLTRELPEFFLTSLVELHDADGQIERFRIFELVKDDGLYLLKKARRVREIRIVLRDNNGKRREKWMDIPAIVGYYKILSLGFQRV